MNKQQAIHLVEDTFQAAFDKARFIRFVKELLNTYEEAEITRTGNYIPDAFEHYVGKYERVGKYTDGEGKRIDILIVYLKRETSIERARSMQRNFVAGYLQGKYGSDKPKDAALVAFVSPDGEDWRFSLVKLEVRLDADEKGKIKVKDELSPARRWSFLVGSQEKSHTAQRQFQPILEDDEHNPTLNQLEEAFNIETVTKEFFNKYRELFIRTKEELDKVVKREPKVKTDFESKGIDTVNLAKKLLGQIIFLYYLQKKGWFGVPRDGAWGEGSKNFLRGLFAKKKDNENFFNDILEHLFYDALRNDRSHDDHYYGRFNCKIPFLNGGLFDPMNDYDWVHTDILLPDNLFSNKTKTKEGDEGDGIFDIFDRYNFTVKEDEPFEKEVAIDPELLGKAYEKFNAIRPDNYDEFLKALTSGKKGEESKFNKQYGVYYTPREIVHYMCQQSLINYLYSELNSNVVYQSLGADQFDMFGNAAKGGQMDMSAEHHPMAEVAKEEIALLIQHGENWRENEERVETTGKETSDYSYKTPESIRENASLIDEKLAAIKVCDPAVGSGAFPVGMMSEIVRARDVLKTWTKTKKTVYDFKRECIENSLYGVDIDSGAVEIAKLRLWLSLIVDEADIQNIKPLPNLDYKIVCGNSLVGLPDGILLDSEIKTKLEEQKKEYFYITNPAIKQNMREEINKLFTRLVDSAKQFDLSLGDVNFDFHTHFSEIFHDRDGFDVVIGNPPYSAKQSTETKSLTKLFHYVEYKCDPYGFFVELGWKTVKKGGQLTYIIPVTWMTNYYYAKLRSLLIQTNSLKGIVLFQGLVFESANVDTCLLFLQKQTVSDRKFSWIATSPSMENLAPRERKYATVEKEARLDITPGFDGGWDLIREKLDLQSVRLDAISKISLGMKLKSNDAFVVDAKDKKHPDPIYFGSDISFFGALKPSRYFNFQTAEIVGGTKNPSIHTAKPKILIQAIRNLSLKRRIVASIDFDGFCFVGTVNSVVIKDKRYDVKLLLAVLNSTLLNVYFRNRFTTISLTSAFLGVLPIKKISDIQTDRSLKNLPDSVIKLVDRILAMKSANPQADTSALENKIDQFVYKLYGLTDEEIRIVESAQ